MTKPKPQQFANRSRRIPRRVRQLQAEIKSIDSRIASIEDASDVSAEYKANTIKSLRKSVSPLNTQLRALVDRGAELGLRIAA